MKNLIIMKNIMICDSLIKKFKECPGDGMADITDLKSVG